MPRTTDAAVRGIVDTEADIDTTPFIATANAMVNNIIATPTNLPIVNDTVTLELIERWLSAHFYSVRDPAPNSETIGQSNQRFVSVVAMGLNQTWWGQQALLMDYSGALTRFNQAAVAGTLGIDVGIFWLGQKTSKTGAPYKGPL